MVIPGNRSFPRCVRGCEWPPRRATSDRSKSNLAERWRLGDGPKGMVEKSPIYGDHLGMFHEHFNEIGWLAIRGQ